MPHTPGPWKAGWGKYIPITAMVNGQSAQIGRAESCGQITDEEVEANGALFAGAPQLLEAAKYSLKVGYGADDCGDHCGNGCHWCELRRAIAKAEVQP